MKRLNYILFVFCILSFFIFCGFSNNETNIKKTVPVARNGEIDLSKYNLKDESVYLSGYWEFYPNKLLEPQDFNTNAEELDLSKDYILYEKYWNEQKGGKYKNTNYATYRLKMKIPDTNEQLSLIFSSFFSSYKIWIDDSLVASVGVVSDKKENYIPREYPSNVNFMPRSEYVQIVIQAANYSAPASGPHRPIKLGSSGNIFRYFVSMFVVYGILIGFVIFIGIYNLVMFFYRKKEITYLLISATTISFSIWFILYNHMLNPEVDNLFGFEIMNKIEHLCITIYPITYYWFISLLFGNRTDKKVFLIFALITSVYSSMIIYTDYMFYRLFLLYYDFFIILFYLYTLYVSVRAYINKIEGSVFMMVANILNAFFVVVEMANVFRIANFEKISIAGMAMIMFFESCVVALRYKNSYVKIKDMTNKLVILDKQKDDFLANTSHELRTPINGIMGISEAMIDGVSGKLPEAAVKNLKMIVMTSKRLLGLINDILDFSKLKNKDVVLNKKEVDLKQLCDLVVTVLTSIYSNKNIEIINNISEEIPYVWADEIRTEQILYNLIESTVKFVNDGNITVYALNKESEVLLCVEGRGDNISKDKYDKFFIFSEKESDTSSIGLNITKQLVELHGGELCIELVDDKYLRLAFTLKKIEGNEKSGKKFMNPDDMDDNGRYDYNLDNYGIDNSLLANRMKTNEKIKILAVDDEEINLEVLKSSLSIYNCEVDTSLNGIEALEKIEKNDYDLILLDLMMPKMSGYDVCRSIRKKKSIFELPVVILTAKSRVVDIVAGFNAGANDYLVKPFEKMELIARVNTLASLKKSVLDVNLLNIEIENTQKEIIFMLAEVAEARSKETGNHIRRVAEYVYVLSVKLGFAQNEAEIMKMASTMHDVGKIGIRDDILNKPGKLTQEEFEIIKTHSMIGYEMLKNSDRQILKTAAIIALEHHEKYNGKGYPFGKKGREISIEGRITAVADVFDALASDRVYKKAWDMDRIIELFKAEKGEHFDPELTDIFLNNVDEFIAIKEKLRDDIKTDLLGISN